jgi:nitrogen fixation protein FixH
MTQVQPRIVSCCGEGGERPVTGRTVFICLVTFFAIVAAVNATMIIAAITTFGGVETGSAYQAGLAFARETAAVEAQDSLGWRVNVSIRTDGGRTAAIEIAAMDGSNQPVVGLQAIGRLAHPMDRRSDRSLTVREIEPGVFLAEVAQIKGQWDLVTELSQNGVSKFRSRNRLTLP